MENLTEKYVRLAHERKIIGLSVLRRELGISFEVAGEQLEIMESMGVVGPFTGQKNRNVLIQSTEHLNQILSELKAKQKAPLYENEPLTELEVSRAIELRKRRESLQEKGEDLPKSEKEEFDRLFTKSFKHVNEINQSGYAGINKSGTIVDRRIDPNSVAIQENEMFWVVKPKSLEEWHNSN